MSKEEKISIAVTTYRRFGFTIDCFQELIEDKRIDEIVIVDDASDDNSFEDLVEYYKFYNHIHLIQNKENVGVYRNKKIAIENCKNNWVLIADSDNVFRKDFIDALFALPEWKENTIYCPSWGKPALDYLHFSGIEITNKNAALYIDQRNGGSLFNTMNCMVNQKFYSKVFDDSVEPVAADSIQTNLNYLLNGGAMYIVPNLFYYHSIHPGSHYVNFTHKSDIYHKQITDKIRLMK